MSIPSLNGFKIIETYYRNTQRICPPEVELPQYGVIIPRLTYQAILNNSETGGMSLRELVMSWIKYRVKDTDFQLSHFQHHIITRCEHSDDPEHKLNFSVYLHNLKIMNLADVNDQGTAQRKEMNS